MVDGLHGAHPGGGRAKDARRRWRGCPTASTSFVDHLDDGSPIAVTITVAGDQAVIDFTGTGPVLAGNLNANRAIVTAAVMYCLRSLIDEDIPLNQGVLAPVRIVLPECLLNPPEGPTPETERGDGGRQRRNVAARGRRAARRTGRGGGQPGDDEQSVVRRRARSATTKRSAAAPAPRPQATGADAVHTHMTNTRLTDPEVLEQRYPVRLREFSIRRGSGGAGRHRGGDGIVRRIEFLRRLGSLDPFAASRPLSALRPGRRPARRIGPQHAASRRRHGGSARRPGAVRAPSPATCSRSKPPAAAAMVHPARGRRKPPGEVRGQKTQYLPLAEAPSFFE